MNNFQEKQQEIIAMIQNSDLDIDNYDFKKIISKYKNELNAYGYDFVYVIDGGIIKKCNLHVLEKHLSGFDIFYESISQNELMKMSEKEKSEKIIEIDYSKYVKKENFCIRERYIENKNNLVENIWDSHQCIPSTLIESLLIQIKNNNKDKRFEELCKEIILDIYSMLVDKKRSLININKIFNEATKNLNIERNLKISYEAGEKILDKITLIEKQINNDNKLLSKYKIKSKIWWIIGKMKHEKKIYFLNKNIEKNLNDLNNWQILNEIYERLKKYRYHSKGESLKKEIYQMEEKINEMWVSLLKGKYNILDNNLYKDGIFIEKNEIDILKDYINNVKEYEHICLGDQNIKMNYYLEGMGNDAIKKIKTRLMNNPALNQSVVEDMLDEVRIIRKNNLLKYKESTKIEDKESRFNNNDKLKMEVLSDQDESIFFEILMGEDYQKKCFLFPVEINDNEIFIKRIDVNNFKLYGFDIEYQYVLMKQLFDIIWDRHSKNELLKLIRFKPFDDSIHISVKPGNDKYKKDLLEEIEYIKNEFENIINGSQFDKDKIMSLIKFKNVELDDIGYIQEVNDIIKKRKEDVANGVKVKEIIFSKNITLDNFTDIKFKKEKIIEQINLNKLKDLISKVMERKDRELYLINEMSKVKPEKTIAKKKI